MVDQQPIPAFMARPSYPFAMRRTGVSGEVVVDFVVTTEGNVTNPQAIKSTRPEFESAAVLAVWKWKFKPAIKDGHTVNCHMQVPIVFSLDSR